MLEPKRYKSEMFEALIKMVEGNWITFPEKYDNKGYLNILQIDSKVAAENERQIRAQDGQSHCNHRRILPQAV